MKAPKKIRTELPEPPQPVADDDLYFDHLKRVNETFYDQIRIADQKAAFIFTFMIAFLISSAEGQQIFSVQRYQTGEPVVIVLSAIIGAAVIVSLIAAILVVLPRHVAKSTSLYWGAWPTRRGDLMAAKDSGNEGYLFEEYLANADALSFINRAKYRHVGLAFKGLMVTVVGYVLLIAWRVVAGWLSGA